MYEKVNESVELTQNYSLVVLLPLVLIYYLQGDRTKKKTFEITSKKSLGSLLVVICFAELPFALETLGPSERSRKTMISQVNQ